MFIHLDLADTTNAFSGIIFLVNVQKASVQIKS